MMATRRLNRRQTNLVLAGSMGFALALAFAFFVIAMPASIFEAIVSASGLPTLVAAAEPPLGESARMIVAAIAGLIAGGGVIALFLLTDRPAPEKFQAVRPFSAAVGLAPYEPMLASMEPAPIHAAPMTFAFVDTPKEPADEPTAPEAQSVKDEPIFLDFRAFRANNPPANDEPPLDLGQWRVVEPSPAVSPAAQAKHITAPAAVAEDDSIPALMQRLETGLDKRAAQGAMPIHPLKIDSSGAGLRSTLDELRKMAVKR